MLVVAPLLGGLALSLGSSLQSRWPASLPALPFASDPTGAWIPIAMLTAAFTFLYWFLPNAAVRFGSAAIGGLFAGVMVTLAQSVYVHFSIGVARADAFFGGFALLPLLFAWIYVFWAIVLLGAEIAFAHQNFALYRQEVRGGAATPAEREAIALQIALDVARCFGAGKPAPVAARSRRRPPGAGAHRALGRGAARRRGDPLDARGGRRAGSGLPARAAGGGDQRGGRAHRGARPAQAAGANAVPRPSSPRTCSPRSRTRRARVRATARSRSCLHELGPAGADSTLPQPAGRVRAS